MNLFHWRRFQLLLRNDLLDSVRKIAGGSLAAAFIGLAVTLMVLSNTAFEEPPPMYAAFLPIALLGGGLLFTCGIFGDMHHPLQRYRYLTLPCSNLERLLSRYLISGPFFYLYVLLAYALYDWASRLISLQLMGQAAAPFRLFEASVADLSLSFVRLHSLAILGAVLFRNHQSVKTILAAFGLVLLLGATLFVTVRILYWDSFAGFFTPRPDSPVYLHSLNPEQFSEGFLLALSAAFSLWLLYLAYLCLRDHET